MIRKHYAACILNFTDQMTRKTLPTFGPTMTPAKSNVVKLASGDRDPRRRSCVELADASDGSGSPHLV
jgi:hypothetical protein